MKSIFNTVALLLITSLVTTAQDWKPDSIFISETGQFAGASYSFNDDSDCFPFVGIQVGKNNATIAFALQIEETIVWMDANGKVASAEVDGYTYERTAFNSIGRINKPDGGLFRQLKYKNQTLLSIEDTSLITPIQVRLDRDYRVRGIIFEASEYVFTIHMLKNRVEAFGDKDTDDLYALQYEGRCLASVQTKAADEAVKIKYKEVDGIPTVDKITGELSGTVVIVGTPCVRVQLPKQKNQAP
jgi:hypothetical protein